MSRCGRSTRQPMPKDTRSRSPATGEPVRLSGTLVSAGLMETLGAKPELVDGFGQAKTSPDGIAT